jgi:hypothetical protein
MIASLASGHAVAIAAAIPIVSRAILRSLDTPFHALISSS